MLSKNYAVRSLRIIFNCRVVLPYQQQCNGYSVAVNVKSNDANSNTSNSSYLENIAAEWQHAKSFNEMPGLTKFRMIRGFMKGGEFDGLSWRDVLLKCRQEFGDTYRFPSVFGEQASVMLFDGNDFERAHRTEGTYPIRMLDNVVNHYRRNRSDGFFHEWMGLADNGEKWWKFRHAVNPVLMQPRNAKLYLDPMQQVSNDFIQRIRDIRDPITNEVPDNFNMDINRLTFESVSVVALDKRFGMLRQNSELIEAGKLFESIQIFLQSFYDMGIKPSLYKYVPTPAYRRFKVAMDNIFDISLKYINEAFERIERRGSNEEGKSVLEQLLKIDRKIAAVMAMDMMQAGIDTTASVISGLLLNVAKNPEKQAILRNEILSALPHHNSRFTIENMQNLPYLRACIKESLRLDPIVFGNMRDTVRDIVLGGYRVPIGTRMFINSNLVLCDERYFLRPNEFLPERWIRASDGSLDAAASKLIGNQMNPFIYLPFGFGPRTCVGKRIADMELELTLANVVRHFEIAYNYPTENAFKHYFVSTPAIPLKFQFTDLKY